MAEADMDKLKKHIELPPITIVMTTYFPDERRKVAARMTLKTWAKNLKYRGFINLHIADDGSPTEYIDHLVLRAEQMQWISITLTQQNRKGVGASLNAGFRHAFEESPLVLYAVDDWMLKQPLDLTPWAQLLMEREDVGMVRLGPPHPNIAGRVEMFTDNWQGWGLRLWRQGFAFAHRPALYHKRMIDRYGWFAENVSALECEHRYNMVFCSIPDSITMPDIVFALPHPWQHLDTPSLSALEPA